MPTGPEFIADVDEGTDAIVIDGGHSGDYGSVDCIMAAVSLSGLPESGHKVARLVDLADWSQEARSLHDQGWKWITFGLDITKVASQRQVEAFVPPEESPAVSQDQVERQVQAAPQIESGLIVSKALYTPSEEPERLAPHFLGEDDQHLQRILNGRIGPFLSASLDIDDGPRLFVEMAGADDEAEENFVHYYHTYRMELGERESDFAPDALSPQTWKLLERLNTLLHNGAVSHLGNVLLGQVSN
jgi:hypothetical protein